MQYRQYRLIENPINKGKICNYPGYAIYTRDKSAQLNNIFTRQNYAIKWGMQNAP